MTESGPNAGHRRSFDQNGQHKHMWSDGTSLIMWQLILPAVAVRSPLPLDPSTPLLLTLASSVIFMCLKSCSSPTLALPLLHFYLPWRVQECITSELLPIPTTISTLGLLSSLPNIVGAFLGGA